MVEALCASLQTTAGAQRGAPTEAHLVSTLEERLHRIEHTMSDQLRSQFEQMQVGDTTMACFHVVASY